MRQKSKAWGFWAFSALLAALIFTLNCWQSARAQMDDAADLSTQQEQEKGELRNMKKEIDDIKSNMQNALQDMSRVQQVASGENIKEFHLQAKESNWEVFPGCNVNACTYNNQTPGPTIRVSEGDQVKIVLHNALKTTTSLYIQGLAVPHRVDGLPRKGAGLINPGEAYVYQFIASQPGTYYYRPQVPHLDQMHRGMVGVIVVEPKSIPKTYERDQIVVLTEAENADINKKAANGQRQTVTGNLFLANGKSAQALPPLELKQGERMRLRVVNASAQPCPFSLTGHRMEIVSQNGSDGVEPHIMRDTITIHPGERMDLEFSADNPGVWSLSSLSANQCSFNGQFPGGFAMVVRYPEAMK